MTFKILFTVSYDQADTIFQINQIQSRITRLEDAVKAKQALLSYDMTLLNPLFIPPIKKVITCGYDISQVDSYINELKCKMKLLEFDFSK